METIYGTLSEFGADKFQIVLPSVSILAEPPVAVVDKNTAKHGTTAVAQAYYNQRSSLGVILDPIADKGLLLSGIITLSVVNWDARNPSAGQFPTWFPVLVISRVLVILIGSAVLHLLNGKVIVRPRWTGKIATVLQMVAIGWVMLQLHFVPLVVIVGLAGFFTFVSGVMYVIDGMGQLHAQGHANATHN